MHFFNHIAHLSQDWSDIRVAVSVVYPEYYFIGTSLVVAVTGVLLFIGDAIG